MMGKVGMNSKFLLVGLLSALTIIGLFFASVLTDDVAPLSVSNNYEELCGYPVTDQMRLDLIYQSSWNSDSSPFKEGIGNFTHTERSLYLTDIPLLQYWFELKDGKKIYFELGACDLDDSDISAAQMNPNYEKPQDIVIDGLHYVEFVGPGSPLIYKDTLLPVLDVDNCQRVAEYGTKVGKWKLFVDGGYDGDDTPWKNQVLPLRDYCQNIGTFELKTADGNINWSFTLK